MRNVFKRTVRLTIPSRLDGAGPLSRERYFVAERAETEMIKKKFPKKKKKMMMKKTKKQEQKRKQK